MSTKHVGCLALAVALFAALPVLATAQTTLPAAMQQQLQAPNANVVEVALRLARANPAYATQLLQACINSLGANSRDAADAVKAFGNLAQRASTSDPAVAAALAVAVENVVADPQNAALVQGNWAGIVNAARSDMTDEVLQNAGVQQAIVDHAPGTEGNVQTATNAGNSGNAFGSFGGQTGGTGVGTSSARP